MWQALDIQAYSLIEVQQWYWNLRLHIFRADVALYVLAFAVATADAHV